jgi:endonuclease/exonuclease/phosphatase family metal-dependent hydrolase
MTLRVGTFNLFQFCKPPFSWYIKKDKFTLKQWEKKTFWIKNQIKQMNCDIIGFQEVFSSEALEELVKELGFKYFKTVDTPRHDKQNESVYTTTTVALASKYPIKEVLNVKPNGYSLKKLKIDGYFRFSRIPIKALIELPSKQEITFYVNHFKSNRLNEFEYVFKKNTTLEEKRGKTKEALENNYSLALKQRLAETSSLYFDFKKCKTPIICVCDLNDKEFSLSIDALTNKAYHENRTKNSYLLYDAYYFFDKKIYNPHPEQKEIKRTPTSYYQGYGNVIDYIFVSKELKPNITSYEVFDEHLQKNPDGNILQSDHASVVCEIKL